MDNGHGSITLGDRSYPIALPACFATRSEILGAMERRPLRAVYASLGVCCPSLDVGTTYDGDVAAYGAAVLNALHNRGADMSEVAKAANQTFDLLLGLFSGSQADAAEVTDTADFTGRPEAPGTGSRSISG